MSFRRPSGPRRYLRVDLTPEKERERERKREREKERKREKESESEREDEQQENQIPGCHSPMSKRFDQPNKGVPTSEKWRGVEARHLPHLSIKDLVEAPPFF